MLMLAGFLLAAPVFAQLRNPSVRLSLNYPFIPSVSSHQQKSAPGASPGYTTQWTNIDGARETYDTKPGFDFGFGVDAFTFKRFFVHARVGVQFNNYHRLIEVLPNGDGVQQNSPGATNGTPGSPYGVIVGGSPVRDENGEIIVVGQGGSATILALDPEVGRTSTMYVQVPVMVGRRFFSDKFGVQLGFAPALLVRATEYKPLITSSNGQYQSEAVKEVSREGFNNMLLNGVVEVSYAFNKKLFAHISYQHSFSPIYSDDNRPGGEALMNSFSVGAGYRIAGF